MNRALKAGIVLKYGTQAAAAKEIGITERRLSRLIHGYDQPRPSEIETLRAKVGVELAARRAG